MRRTLFCSHVLLISASSVLQTCLPFAVVGSTEDVKVGNRMVKGRLYPWGTVQGELKSSVSVCSGDVESVRFCQTGRAILAAASLLFPVENEDHCDLVKLREMLLRVNTEDLREQTHSRHYELYRRCKLEEMGFKDTDPDSQSFR